MRKTIFPAIYEVAMNSEEQTLIDGLFSRLQQAETDSAPRDAQAEARIKEHLTRQPAAGYFMTQAILVQEAAIKSLDEQNKQQTQQIQQLQDELQQAKAQASAPAPASGGFLSSIFGGGSRDPQPAPTQSAPPSTGGWREPARPSFNSQPPQQNFGAPQQNYGAPQQNYAPQQQAPVGSGFLGGALKTAAGVAGANQVGQFYYASGGGQDQRETGVGRGFGQHVGSVAEQDPSFGQVIDVVVVDAHRDAGNRFQIRCEVEQCSVQFQTRTQQALSLGQGRAQLGEALGIQAFDQGHVGLLMQASHQQRREFLVQHNLLFHRHRLNFNSRVSSHRPFHNSLGHDPVTGAGLEENRQHHREHQRAAHQQIRRAGRTGGAVQIADQIRTAKRAKCAHAIDQRHGATGNVGRQDLRDDRKKRPVRCVHAGAGDHQQGVGPPEVFSAQRIRTVERNRGDEQRRPHKAFALLQFVRAPGHRKHADHRCQVRQRREPAGFDHVHLQTSLEDRRQPQHKTVDANAPAEKLQGQHDHFRRAEGFGVVLHGFDANLFGGQGAFQVLFFLVAEPLGLG